jgi:hypothetical protein
MGMHVRNLQPSTGLVMRATAMLAIAATAGCQLLLPDGDDGTGGDASSSTGRGGAMATSSNKASSSTSAQATVTASVDVSASASSSTGGKECDPGGAQCDETTTFLGCASNEICQGNDECSGYCTLIESCANAGFQQYGNAKQCCQVCEFALGNIDPLDSLCCRADALDLAPAHASCTAAGPFGISGTVPAICGEQSVHVCKLLFAACTGVPNILNCNENICEGTFGDATTTKYQYNSGGNDPIGLLMDKTLKAIDASDKASACAEAFELACPIASVSVATSGGG